MYNWQIITAIIIISNNVLEDIIWKRYLKNKQAQRVLIKSTEGFKKTDTELLLFKRLVYVLKYQQNDTMKMYHNDLLSEHWEVHKMIKAISWLYYFSHMWRKVQSYINKCDLCHKIKLSRHISYKEMRTVLTSD